MRTIGGICRGVPPWAPHLDSGRINKLTNVLQKMGRPRRDAPTNVRLGERRRLRNPEGKEPDLGRS
jgi:hypothetical protein